MQMTEALPEQYQLQQHAETGPVLIRDDCGTSQHPPSFDTHCSKGDRQDIILTNTPTRHVSFAGCQSMPAESSRTVATVIECDYDDRDYDDIDYNDYDDITTNSPTSVMEANLSETLLTTKNSKIPRVRFSDQPIKCRNIRHINDMSMKERDRIWITADEFQNIKSTAKMTVLRMMSGNQKEDPDFCTRGLECKTSAGSKQRKKNKIRVRRAVLNEQDVQREEGFYDPRFIAMASMVVSFEGREEACKQGERDYLDVQSYLKDVPRVEQRPMLSL